MPNPVQPWSITSPGRRVPYWAAAPCLALFANAAIGHFIKCDQPLSRFCHALGPQSHQQFCAHPATPPIEGPPSLQASLLPRGSPLFSSSLGERESRQSAIARGFGVRIFETFVLVQDFNGHRPLDSRVSREHGEVPNCSPCRPHWLAVPIHQWQIDLSSREDLCLSWGTRPHVSRHAPLAQSHSLSRRRLPTPDPTVPQSPIILVQISSPLLFFTLAPPVTVNCRRIHALFSFQLPLHSVLGFFDLSG